jgi:hypothetical protein
MGNPLKYFAELRDPHIERNREHLLEEILLIAIAAVLSGAESWNDMAVCGHGEYRVSGLPARNAETRSRGNPFRSQL